MDMILVHWNVYTYVIVYFSALKTEWSAIIYLNVLTPDMWFYMFTALKSEQIFHP